MTAADFFWSEGHIGWPLFSIVVFTILCLVVTDVVWRVVRMSFRNLLICAVLVWIVGMVVLVGCSVT